MKTYSILAAIPPVIIGIIGNAVPSWEQVGAGGPPPDASLILPYVIRYLTPASIATIGLGTIAAAVMSSVDSSILSASSMAGWNVYRPLIKPKVTSVQLGKVIKRIIWIIGISATLLALKISSVYALWFLCSDFVYCLLFPQLLTALFDKKANSWGALSGFIVSLLLRLGGGDPTLGIPALLKSRLRSEALKECNSTKQQVQGQQSPVPRSIINCVLKLNGFYYRYQAVAEIPVLRVCALGSFLKLSAI